MTAGQLISDLLRRVRDPQGAAHPRATVLDLLDRVQTLFVRSTGTLVRERAIDLAPERCLYDLDPSATLRVLDVYRSDGERLWPVRWSQLASQLGPTWWRYAAASGPRVWAPFGASALFVWPALPALGVGTVTLREQRRPTALTDETVTLELPDEHLPALRDFVEALLLLRGRDAALAEALAQVEAYAGPTGAAAA